MSTEPVRYSKKPQPVEAMQYVAGAGPDIALWCGGEYVTVEKPSDPTDRSEHVVVPHVKGSLVARPDAYVVKNPDGKFNVCDAPTFEKDYEPER